MGPMTNVAVASHLETFNKLDRICNLLFCLDMAPSPVLV